MALLDDIGWGKSYDDEKFKRKQQYELEVDERHQKRQQDIDDWYAAIDRPYWTYAGLRIPTLVEKVMALNSGNEVHQDGTQTPNVRINIYRRGVTTTTPKTLTEGRYQESHGIELDASYNVVTNFTGKDSTMWYRCEFTTSNKPPNARDVDYHVPNTTCSSLRKARTALEQEYRKKRVADWKVGAMKWLTALSSPSPIADVKLVEIGPCMETYPCQHTVSVTYKGKNGVPDSVVDTYMSGGETSHPQEGVYVIVINDEGEFTLQ